MVAQLTPAETAAVLEEDLAQKLERVRLKTTGRKNERYTDDATLPLPFVYALPEPPPPRPEPEPSETPPSEAAPTWASRNPPATPYRRAQFAGVSSAMRLTGWSLIRSSTSTRYS